MTVFDRRNETMHPELLAQVQLERVQALLARLRRNVRRYRELLGDMTVETLPEVANLPLTSPSDLAEAFPYGMFALPLREVIRLHSFVGLDGRPLVVGHTRNDLANWGRLTARQLVAAGVTSHDVIQIVFGSGYFGHSLGYLLGAELVEASVTPEYTFHIEYQLEVLRNYRTTVLITDPTNARDLVRLLRARRIDPQTLHLRTVLLTRVAAAETRSELETGLYARVHANFGVPEIMDPGFCVECEHGGWHVNEDHFLVEIVDGELVVTTLCREAMPLLRYRTNIACALRRTHCACGRTGLQLVPGERLDARLLVNEMPLYEKQIATVLAKTRAAGQPFQVRVSEHGVAVAIEVSEQFFADKMRVLADLRVEIAAEFLSRLGIHAEVTYVAPGQSSASQEAAAAPQR